VANAAVLLFGGIETTEGMIANAILYLLQRPEHLAPARGDARFLDGVIEESLRLEPAAAVVDRYATRTLNVVFKVCAPRLGPATQKVAAAVGADQDVRKINGRWLITKAIASSVTLKP